MSRNNWRWTIRVAIAALWLIGPGLVRAADNKTATDKSAALERWQHLSPAEQTQLLENYRQFKSLSLKQREDLRKRWKEFEALPPDHQTRIREAYRRFTSLSPKEQEQIRKNWARWQALTPEEQAKLEQTSSAHKSRKLPSPPPHSRK